MKQITVRTAWGAAVVAALFLALLLIPATYHVQVGSVVSLTLPGATQETARAVQQVTENQPTIERASMMKTPDGLTMRFVLNETDTGRAQAMLANLLREPLAGLGSYELVAEPVTVERGGNALAAITGGVIHISTEGMSDAEIEQAIVSALLGQGASEASASVTTTPDGMRNVEIEVRKEMQPGEDAGEPIEIQLDGDSPGDGAKIEREMILEGN